MHLSKSFIYFSMLFLNHIVKCFLYIIVPLLKQPHLDTNLEKVTIGSINVTAEQNETSRMCTLSLTSTREIYA